MPAARPSDERTGGMQRVVGVPGAVLLGLGSIVGTGVFVSLGLAAELTGPSVVWAVMLAALVATCNGLSSAQLAAHYPVSGGTYEYGYRTLTPALGFSAGFLFLAAKSASAAAAALGCVGYAHALVGASPGGLRAPLAVAVGAGMTGVVVLGMRRSNVANAAIVGLTLLALGAFVLFGLPTAFKSAPGQIIHAVWPKDGAAFLQATALVFVAYTGYGRIATLGEEVREPRRSIPQAMVLTLLVSMTLYAGVAFVSVGVASPEALAQTARQQVAPLALVAERLSPGVLGPLVAVGAVTAMLGVLLNLLLGLSRVVLAMARRGDLPAGLAALDASGSPRRAVVLVGAVVCALAAGGSVKATWSFSAFTVLVYYALTNLAALRLPAEARLYPRALAWLGLVGCAGLAFWVDRVSWLSGLGVLAVGLLWHRLAGAGRGAG